MCLPDNRPVCLPNNRPVCLPNNRPVCLPDKMKVNCQEHRKSMALLGLKLRLKDASVNDKEREEIEKQIAILEKELNLD